MAADYAATATAQAACSMPCGAATLRMPRSTSPTITIAGLPMCCARMLAASVPSVQTSCRCCGSEACWTTAAGVAAPSPSSRPDCNVSIEVTPTLAHDAAGTIAEAKRLWAKVDRENALIKIPATLAGLDAITEVIGAGISVNVTLIFSLDRHKAVIEAYLAGLEKARTAGIDLSGIHSVASFFVSRVDTEVDQRLVKIGTPEAIALKSRAGIANARLAYQLYENEFNTPRAASLLASGANPQRPLWASTGVKDPSLPDTLYVTELVSAGVVNTMPEKTLRATFDHGVIAGDTVTTNYDDAAAVFAALAAVGVDIDDVTTLLENEGVSKFITSWGELLETVRNALEGAK